MAYDWQKKKYQMTHEKLLQVAASTLRQNGVKKTSVAKVMQNAGMTVGAFYAHFDSKKDLIEKSFAWAVNTSKQRIEDLPDTQPGERLTRFLNRSLSAEHRDTPGDGCPLSALSLDFSREDKELREFFSATLNNTLQHRLKAFTTNNAPLTEEDLIELHSTLVGAMILARATRGTALSEHWMDVVRRRLTARFINNQQAEE